ncbi:MAG: glycosyltransferase [Deltaproteobacteria bacterium]|nr:glycosyltransferase [Deltaproteobacteria bacterium]
MMSLKTIPRGNDALPLASVAVCSRDRVHYLDRCLSAIEQLTYPRLDVLVIDNAPGTAAAERLVRDKFTRVRYIVEPRPGLDWARNRAIAEAHGEIIAFTDDDVVVEPGWIDAIVHVFVEDRQIMAVTGLVTPYELETEAQILFERYGGFGKGQKRKSYPAQRAANRSKWSHLAAGDMGTGANMAFRRSLFDHIGGFDPALDTGTATTGGGDLEIFFRTVEKGYRLVYEPAAKVRHIHRRDYRQLKSQIRSWGIAFTAYLTRSIMAFPASGPRITVFAFRWLIGRHLMRFLRHTNGPERLPPDLMLTEMAGSLAGPLAYFKARRDARKIESDFGDIN